MDYFDKAETWDRATLETVQLARLKTTIQQASRAPFYAKRLAEAGVSADNLRSLEDIRRIPRPFPRFLTGGGGCAAGVSLDEGMLLRIAC